MVHCGVDVWPMLFMRLIHCCYRLVPFCVVSCVLCHARDQAGCCVVVDGAACLCFCCEKMWRVLAPGAGCVLLCCRELLMPPVRASATGRGRGSIVLVVMTGAGRGKARESTT
ncbi:hypothetical protein RND81_11G071000 [Saponaria officinalis]|uniref:Uncharacterized protein n=1 Tax=Saponaria officinalis TaxID=3572 RepID=A0AAW1HIZ7_SAPOF